MQSGSPLRRVVEEFFARLLDHHPEVGTQLGLHQYDPFMPKAGKEAVEADKRLVIEFREKLLSIDPQALSEDERIDRELAIQMAELSIFNIEEWPMWRMMPYAPEVVGGALYPLFTREYAPYSVRFRSIVSRLSQVPEYLEKSRELLEDPVRVFVDIGIEMSRAMSAFVGMILETSKQLLGEYAREYEEYFHKASDAINRYAEWLMSVRDKAREDFAMGPERFRRLLKLRGIDMEPEEILRFGEEKLAEYKRELARLADLIKPGASIEEVKRMLEAEHPKSFREVLEAYRAAVERARRFVVEKGLATIPPNEELRVLETPPYLIPIIPFAAYIPPAKFEGRLTGIYLVTPVDESKLSRHNYYSISNTSVHEAYPGHHLQLSCAMLNDSLVRLMVEAPEFVEGWAHYCEDLMKEHGFDDTPKHRFVQLLDGVWRAARVIIDVKLSTGQMSFEEAVEFLVRETGMDREAAKAEVKRYTYTPGYQLSYLLGKHMFKELREYAKKRLGSKFSERWFHDTLLYAGSVPIKYAKAILDREIEKLLSKR